MLNQKKPEGRQQKEIVEAQKAKVKAKVLEKFHLKVDSVQQGKGSTNNGPTARALFGNPTLFAGTFFIHSYNSKRKQKPTHKCTNKRKTIDLYIYSTI